MAGAMTAVCAADNIISPLGWTTEENIAAVLAGRSALMPHEGAFGLTEPFVASLIDRTAVSERFGADAGMYTVFEQMCILSIREAVSAAGIDASAAALVLSTTKANVDSLGTPRYVPPADSAARIAAAVGVALPPLVVSNACISGVCAQIEAKRILAGGKVPAVIVCGCDVQSRFIVSGFQSFKALSPQECRPFDASRCGLNLGEAAATVVYVAKDSTQSGGWILRSGAVRNDANHISGPSRTGEGSYRALRHVTAGIAAEDLAFISAHGTATPYNDEMESIAIERTGLLGVPVNSFKGYYGHTMGAAGVLECILSMHAFDRGLIPATRGFGTLGVSRPVDVSAAVRDVPPHAMGFVKLISGFGGCNAAALFLKGEE